MSAINSSSAVTAAAATQARPPHGGRGHHHHGGPDKAAFAQAAQSAGLDASKVSDVQKQIDDALKAAGGKGNGKDLRATIDGILQKNGVDLDKFHAAMQAQFEAKRAQHAQTAAKPDADGDHDGSKGIDTHG